MAAIAGILNHHLAGGKPLTDPGAKPMASTSGSTASSASASASNDSSTISANDFLTLLVTEMQNQDPTANTDPNEYINQLVQVNSLEQLIDINQNVSAALGTTSSDSASTASASSTAGKTKSSALETSAGHNLQGNPALAPSNPNKPTAIHDSVAQLAPGNLSMPAVNSAAESVARALNGRNHSKSAAASLPGAH